MAKAPSPLDGHIGARIRMRRAIIGMSQEKLAERLGVTFQQVQKYEKGTNRISASRLHQAAEILGVPITYFFEERPATGKTNENAEMALVAELLARKEGVDLVRALSQVKSAKVRRALIDLARAASARSDADENV